MKVEESLNVTFDESPPPTKLSPLVDDDVGEEEAIKKSTKVVNNNNEEDESIEVDETANIKESKNHPLNQVIENLNQRTLRIFDKHEYSMGMVDNTLFTKKSKSHLIIIQIYVEDIIFGSTTQNLCDDFGKIMHDEFEMNMMGELNFFLGLQIKQMEDEIFFNQSKYIKEMLKKFGLEDSKPTKTPMSTEIKLTKDDEADSTMKPTPWIALNIETTHLEAIKRIFRYIRGTSHLGLWYPKGEITTQINQMDYNQTQGYLPRIHRTRRMDEDLRESYRNLEKRLFHEGRIVTPSFITENKMLPFFEAVGLEPFLTLNEPICPRFVVEFYHSLEVKINEEQRLS
ncbi:copia protein [Tanacetum coccineum]